jgi:plasmid stabilization system protein ParE
MRVLRRPRFLLDLAEELTWLNERAGGEVAAAWYSSLNETIGQLERHPYLGRQRKDLRPSSIRSWRLSQFPRWLIFYEVIDQDLILCRVRQGSMNLTVLRMKS